jgi:DNA-binding transcriptional regulator WhiA
MKLTIEDEKIVASMYQAGCSYQKIIKEISKFSSDGTIYRIIRKYGVQRKFRTKVPTINHYFFETIDTPEKAYWIGMLMADGYVNRRNYVSLQLKIADADLIEQFGIDLNVSRKPIICKKKMNGKMTYQLRQTVASAKIVEDLKKYGVVCGKTNREVVPDIPYLSDFLRGLIDGDGSIVINGKGYPMIRLTSSEKCIRKAKVLIMKNCNLNDNKISHYQNMAAIGWTGLDQCKKILQFIYVSPNRYLQRKKIIADAILKASSISELGRLIHQK